MANSTKKTATKKRVAAPKRKVAKSASITNAAGNAKKSIVPATARPEKLSFTLDTKTKSIHFRGSLNETLKDVSYTEAELIQRACELVPGYTPEMIAREGMRTQAKRMIATALSSSAKSADHGILDSGFERFKVALELCKKEGIELTPTRIGDRANPPVNLRSAKKYMIRLGLWTESQ